MLHRGASPPRRCLAEENAGRAHSWPAEVHQPACRCHDQRAMSEHAAESHQWRARSKCGTRRRGKLRANERATASPPCRPPCGRAPHACPARGRTTAADGWPRGPDRGFLRSVFVDLARSLDWYAARTASPIHVHLALGVAGPVRRAAMARACHARDSWTLPFKPGSAVPKLNPSYTQESSKLRHLRSPSDARAGACR